MFCDFCSALLAWQAGLRSGTATDLHEKTKVQNMNYKTILAAIFAVGCGVASADVTSANVVG